MNGQATTSLTSETCFQVTTRNQLPNAPRLHPALSSVEAMAAVALYQPEDKGERSPKVTVSWQVPVPTLSSQQLSTWKRLFQTSR